MSYKEKMRERTFMGKFRRTRLHDMSGRHSGDYVPVDMDGMNGDPPYEVDIDEYMAELEEALES